jgi:hypothetical protein
MSVQCLLQSKETYSKYTSPKSFLNCTTLSSYTRPHACLKGVIVGFKKVDPLLNNAVLSYCFLLSYYTCCCYYCVMLLCFAMLCYALLLGHCHACASDHRGLELSARSSACVKTWALAGTHMVSVWVAYGNMGHIYMGSMSTCWHSTNETLKEGSTYSIEKHYRVVFYCGIMTLWPRPHSLDDPRSHHWW